MSTGQLDPNLRLGDKGTSRYPSPFFDVSQQYMPPTMKELFKWCYFYATTNSFVGPALNKIARYPITDLVFDSQQPELITQYEHLFNRVFKIKSFLTECNLDLCTYGNAFVTIYYPFTRFVECKACGHRDTFKTAKTKITKQLKVILACKKCQATGEAKIVDRTYRSVDKINMIRLNPQQVDIKHNEVSGETQYLYSIPDKLKRMIMSGDKTIYESTPQVYIDAIKRKLKIKLNRSNIFHLKRPTVAGKDYGWGVPLLSYVLKDLYYFYTIRRGQEAILNEFITPLDVISPAPNGQLDPYRHANLSSFRQNIQDQIQKHRRDPNYKAIVPFPIQYQRIGGDGKAMLLQGELDFLAKSIIGGMGIPQEFVYGGLTWSGSSVSLRTLENEFMHQRTQLLDLCYWMKDRTRVYLGVPDIEEMRFLDFKMADNVQRLTQVINLEAGGKISTGTMLQELGFDFETEQKKRLKENDLLQKVNDRMTLQTANVQGKLMEVQMRQQAKAVKLQAELALKTGGLPGADPAAGGVADPAAGGGMPGANPAAAGGQAQPGMQAAPMPNQGAAPEAQNNQASAQLPPGQQGMGTGQPASQMPQSQVLGDVQAPVLQKSIDQLAQKIMAIPPEEQQQVLQELQKVAPQIALKVKSRINELSQQAAQAPAQAPGATPAQGGAAKAKATPKAGAGKSAGYVTPAGGENKMPRAQGAI